MIMKIGIIGYGNMGSAIAEYIKGERDVFIFDKDKAKTQNLKGMAVADSIIDLTEKSDVIMLAVKPQDFDETLKELKGSKHLADKLFVSIAAGINSKYINDRLGIVRVVRVMPNLAIKAGNGLSALSRGEYATADDFDFVEDLFVLMGETIRVDERKMNAITAVSGSGPGFFYYAVEKKGMRDLQKTADEFSVSLKEAAERLGFDADTAKILALATTGGAQVYLERSRLSPAQAKKQVASKGGTTEAGLSILEKGGTLIDAVIEAAKRAEELSRKYSV